MRSWRRWRLSPPTGCLSPIPMMCPLGRGLREAASHRPEIEQAELSLRNQQVAIQATRNSLLPSLDVYASYYLAGLDGALRPTFGNIFQNDFPNYSYGVTLDIPIRNRTAQADAARALLEQRQLQMKLQNAKDQAVWDVSKAVSAVQQARDRLDAVLKLVTLARQVHEMQHQKSHLGFGHGGRRHHGTTESGHSPRPCRDSPRHLCQGIDQYEQATGTLLDRHNIALSEAIDGEVHRVPNIPGTREPAK
jgi:outer membrane protein